MPANKMPEFAWPLKFYDVNGKPAFMKHQLAAVVDAYGRACYLAAIEAAKACVPEADDPSLYDDPHSADLRAAAQAEVDYRDEFLTNLTALEQEFAP